MGSELRGGRQPGRSRRARPQGPLTARVGGTRAGRSPVVHALLAARPAVLRVVGEVDAGGWAGLRAGRESGVAGNDASVGAAHGVIASGVAQIGTDVATPTAVHGIGGWVDAERGRRVLAAKDARRVAIPAQPIDALGAAVVQRPDAGGASLCPAGVGARIVRAAETRTEMEPGCANAAPVLAVRVVAARRAAPAVVRVARDVDTSGIAERFIRRAPGFARVSTVVSFIRRWGGDRCFSLNGRVEIVAAPAAVFNRSVRRRSKIFEAPNGRASRDAEREDPEKSDSTELHATRGVILITA